MIFCSIIYTLPTPPTPSFPWSCVQLHIGRDEELLHLCDGELKPLHLFVERISKEGQVRIGGGQGGRENHIEPKYQYALLRECALVGAG